MTATTTISAFASRISIVLLAACGNSAPESDSTVLDQGLVLVGPAENLRQHAEYVRQTWPEAYAVAVVRLLDTPACSGEQAEISVPELVYCWVPVSGDELLAGSWSHLNNPAEKDSPKFRLHYWYPRTELRSWRSGDRLVAFLAPTRSETVYSGTAIMNATDKIVSSVRDALL